MSKLCHHKNIDEKTNELNTLSNTSVQGDQALLSLLPGNLSGRTFQTSNLQSGLKPHVILIMISFHDSSKLTDFTSIMHFLIPLVGE